MTEKQKAKLDKEIKAELKKQNAELKKQNAKLTKQNVELTKDFVELNEDFTALWKMYGLFSPEEVAVALKKHIKFSQEEIADLNEELAWDEKVLQDLLKKLEQ